MSNRALLSQPWLIAIFLALMSAALARAEHQRQAIKVSVPSGHHPVHSVPIDQLAALSALPQLSVSEYAAKRITDSPSGASLHEGDILRTTGWIHLVAHDPGDDDYHIQMTGSQTDGDHCVIVEVPAADAALVSSSMSTKFDGLRATLRDKLEKGKDFSKRGSTMVHPVHVTVTGQLFYDMSHQAHPEARGKNGMHAAAAWELHPVTAITYLTHLSH